MMQDVLSFASQLVAEGNKVALVTVTATRGSSPASPGQMMAVTAQGKTMGTVGGGTTEYQVIQQAIAAIGAGETVFHFNRNHGESGMVCGGEMEGYGTVLGNENHLFIFGGGHVGQRLAPIALATGFFVTVVEDRSELADAFPEGVKFICSDPQDYEEKVIMTGSPYVVICTRGHATDDDALRYCLTQTTKYLGMIGSKKKVAALFDGLRQLGYTQERLDEIYTPIGLNIASGIPAEIAVSILAEMLMVKNNGSSHHKKGEKTSNSRVSAI